MLIIVRVGLNLTHGSSSNNTTFAKSGVSNADVGNDTIRHNVSSAPVRVLVSQSEQVDFPREGGKGAYEMNMLDSESYNQKASFTTDSV